MSTDSCVLIPVTKLKGANYLAGCDKDKKEENHGYGYEPKECNNSQLYIKYTQQLSQKQQLREKCYFHYLINYEHTENGIC